MKPTDEEDQKLRLYDGDYSQLGLAEQVMKALTDIPFAYKRISALLFMTSLQEDASVLRDSFLQLEVSQLKTVDFCIRSAKYSNLDLNYYPFGVRLLVRN
jgi:hypothetical protein